MIDKDTTLNELIDILKASPEAVEAAKGELLEKEVERLREEVQTLKTLISEWEEILGFGSDFERLAKKIKDDEEKIKSHEKKLESSRKLRRPGARMLRDNGILLAQSKDGSISVYTCGYAFYKNASRQSVVWVPDALKITRQTFTPLSRKEKESTGMTDYDSIDTGSLPWEVALVLLGEEATWRNAGGQNPDDGLEEKPNNSIHMSCRIEGPEEAVLHKEEVREALEKLTETEYRALLLNKVWGYSQDEIAEMLGCKRASVETHIRRAKKKVGGLRLL